MKHCRYFLELSGNDSVVELLEQYVPKELPNLRQAREMSRSLDTVFGNAVRPRIIVKRISSSVNAYLLDPIGRHA